MNASSPLRIVDSAPGSPDPGSVFPRTDRELLEAWCLDQEHAALARLVEKYSPLVLSVCRRQCRTADDIDDAFQATFLQLARGAGQIRYPEALAGWLHRTAYRIACRARQRRSEQADALLEDPPDPARPLEQVARRHELRILDEELAALPERYRAAIALHFLEGRTHAQIADQLGTTTGAVRGRLQRGKMQLRRRLRCRGIIPGAVATALAAWPADPAAAAAMAEQFVGRIPQSGGFPEPSAPDAPESISPALKPLLQPGAPTMPVASLVTGSVVAATLGLVLLAGSLGSSSGDQGEATAAADRGAVVTLNPAPKNELLAQVGGGLVSGDTPQRDSAANDEEGNQQAMPGGAEGAEKKKSKGGEAGGGYGTGREMGMGMEMSGTEMGMSMGPSQNRGGDRASGSGGAESLRHSATAQRILKRLDEPVDVSLGSIPVGELESLGEQLDMPVLIDPRGIEAAGAEGETVEADVKGLPLRTALRKMLRPLALKAVVEDDGLVITADTAELARRGIGTSQWISIDNEAAEKISSALDETGSQTFIETPLEDAARQLSEQLGFPVVIDRRALEEVGLTTDAPVSVDLSGVTLRVILQQMLAELDLSYANRGEFLAITTPQAAESRLLTRIYWLDATGLASDAHSLMQAIQTSIYPSTWEALGGPSSMVPMTMDNRQALVVSTVTPVHEEIESFLSLLRENFFGEPSQTPAKPTGAPLRRGGMGGGMGGMGGGMGGMGGGMGGMGGGGMF